MIEAFLHGWSLRDTIALSKAEYTSGDLSRLAEQTSPRAQQGLSAAWRHLQKAARPKGRAASFQGRSGGYSAAKA
ncbi:MAG: hypothetical protein K2X25_11735 [Caulobacteraceae bacterium]|nr:hypothetical protein [Caulobacteraceae bacterium]